MTTTTQPTCKDRITEHYRGRMKDLRKLVKLDRAGKDEGDPDLGTLNEYGLCFDYVPAGTFKNRRGYWRYQLSYGGPSDEFRFYADEYHGGAGRGMLHSVEKVEYWFLDWFDGAHRTLRQGRDFDFLVDLFGDFDECGTVEYAKAQALA